MKTNTNQNTSVENYSKIDFKEIRVNDLKIFCRFFGNPKAHSKYLILHGWTTAGANSWEDFVTQFNPEENFIVFPDLPALGRSSDPSEVWGAKDYAEFFWDFIQKVFVFPHSGEMAEGQRGLGDLEEVGNQKEINLTLVGHSFGGAIASYICSLEYEKDYGNIIDRLILLAPAIIRNRKLTFKQEVLKFITSSFKMLFALPGLNILNDYIKKFWYKIIGSPDYAKTSGMAKKIMRRIIREDLEHILPYIDKKTLIIWGEDDKMTPVSDAHKVNSGIKHSRLEIFSGVNHGLHLHASKEVYNLFQS
jgi:pimeloyl-ACP methyl ester carboxylesterase